MKISYAIILLLAALLCLAACQIDGKVREHQSVAEIPSLLLRDEAIQHGEEWSEVQANYQKHRLAFRANLETAYAGLAIVELFTTEARITGKHRHYYTGALQLVEQVLAIDSLERELEFYALTLQAGVLHAQNDFTEALSVAQAAEQLQSNNAQVQGVLVDCYVELGQYEKAITAADAMMAIRPDIHSYTRLSYLREIHGDIDGALLAMQMAVSAGLPGKEETSWASFQLAELLHRNDRNKDASKILNAILEERPNYPFAKGALAEIKLEQQELASAKTLLDEAINAVPLAKFYITLAQYYRAFGDEAAFAKTTEQVKAILADDVASGLTKNLEYAQVYFILEDDPETALTYMKKAYDARPENIDVNREIARIYKAIDKPIHLDYHLKKACRTNSKHPDLKSLVLSLRASLERLS